MRGTGLWFIGMLLLGTLGAGRSLAATGDIVATFPGLEVSQFTRQPNSPYMYATLPSQNSVAVFNTQTLALEGTYFVGSSPRGMAFSPDGSQLYVANSSSNFLAVFNTASRSVTRSLLMPEVPRDVEVGNGNRLFVLGTDHLMQIDATTGASAGPNLPVHTYGGMLEISPNRNTLFYGDTGLSPASLYKIDVTTTNAVKLWESPHGGLSGENGQDLTISADGSFISYPCGAGQGGYQIAKYDTATMAILGSFKTGAYPREIAFSPDGAVAYATHTAGEIDLFSTSTFLPLGKFNVPSSSGDRQTAHEMLASGSGRYLFAAVSDYGGPYNVLVYDTGILVPEPGTYLLALTGCGTLLAIAVHRRRRDRSGVNTHS